jgi:predicted nucleic acid-binding protein
MRVYMDSAPIIYLVEGVVPYARALETRLFVPGTVQVCSDLTRLECRVKPMQEGQTALLAAFDRYFADIVRDIVPLSRQALDRATSLRARYGFKTPDAIHLAAAIVGECDLFLTNDRRLCQCAEIAVEVV